VSRAPRASGYFRTSYAQDLALVGTRLERTSLGVFILALLAFPFAASAFQLDLACQVFLACVGALSLMLLTGYAGQISLGHAGLMAAGAFTVGILFRETNAPFWITLPCAALVGALLAAVVGIGAGAIALEAGQRVLDDEPADILIALGERRRGPQQHQNRTEDGFHASSRSWRVSSPSASRNSCTMVKWSAPATGISGPGRCSADRLACRSRLSATSGGSSAVP